MKEIRVDTIEHISNTNTLFNFASSGALGVGGANYGTSGQVLTSQGSGSSPTWNNPTISVPSVQVITSSGTYTPTSGKTIFHVYCIGAGGGGTSAARGGSGGGSGGCAFRVYNSTEMGSSASVTIGSGGVAGVGGGGDTEFDPAGSGLTITGGGGGGNALAGGAGGSSTNAQLVWYGNSGKSTYTLSVFVFNSGQQNYVFHGKGGASVAYGGGKGGDGTANGDNGLVVVFEY